MTPGGGETWQRKEDAARSRGGTTAGTVCSIAAVTLSGTASTTTGGSQRGPRRWNDMRSPRRHRRVNEYRLVDGQHRHRHVVQAPSPGQQLVVGNHRDRYRWQVHDLPTPGHRRRSSGQTTRCTPNTSAALECRIGSAQTDEVSDRALGLVTIRQGRGVTMTARESATHTRSSGGWVARREAAVRVLTDLAGLSTVDLTGLTAADVTVLDGAATISTPTRTVTVPPATGGMCGPCTLARWLHTLGPDRGAHRPARGHRRLSLQVSRRHLRRVPGVVAIRNTRPTKTTDTKQNHAEMITTCHLSRSGETNSRRTLEGDPDGLSRPGRSNPRTMPSLGLRSPVALSEQTTLARPGRGRLISRCSVNRPPAFPEEISNSVDGGVEVPTRGTTSILGSRAEPEPSRAILVG